MFVCVGVCVCVCSARAAQRTCEEGGVEPEAATGGDCSDDTLLAGNGDTQLYVNLSKTISSRLGFNTLCEKIQRVLGSYYCPLSCLSNNSVKLGTKGT